MQLSFTYFIRTALWIALVYTSQVAKAQVKFSTAVNPGEDGYIEVEYIIENAVSVENFSPPGFKNFQIVQPPSQSESTTNINGHVSTSQSISYLLRAEAAGKFIIEGATAIIDGKKMHSGVVAVQINKKGSSGRQKNVQPSMPVPFMEDFLEDRSPVAEDYRLRPGENVKEKIAKNVLVKLDVNKTTCYEGEPVMATYKLYYRLKLEPRITKRPSFNGFSVYDMIDVSDNGLKIEKVNGKNFNVHVFRRSQLFPLQAGSYTLDPLELDNKVQFLRAGTSASSGSHNPVQRIMERLFGGGESGEVEEHSVTMRSNPVTINVKPLPKENKPAGFKGAVGKFTIQAELKNKTIATGDAALLEVMIQGAGNLPVVNAPDINLPAGMEAFDPVVKESIDKTVYPLKGSKTFDYTFIAHDTGSFTIPSVQFSYFDPATASYKTISSGPFAIRVLKGNKQYNGAASAPASGAKAIPASYAWKAILSSFPFMLSLIVVLLGIIVYLLIKNRGKNKISPQPEITKAKSNTEQKPVERSAPDPLQDAKLALHLGRSGEFYSEINKAIRKAADSRAGTLGVEALQEMEVLRKECEIALYTPGYEDKDRQLILERAEKCLKL
jgi:hypothetical protein